MNLYTLAMNLYLQCIYELVHIQNCANKIEKIRNFYYFWDMFKMTICKKNMAEIIFFQLRLRLIINARLILHQSKFLFTFKMYLFPTCKLINSVTAARDYYFSIKVHELSN